MKKQRFFVLFSLLFLFPITTCKKKPKRPIHPTETSTENNIANLNETSPVSQETEPVYEQCLTPEEVTKSTPPPQKSTTPSKPSLSVSSNQPYKADFSSESVYSHALVTLCKDEKQCKETYSIDDYKFLDIDWEGQAILKVKLCSRESCSPEETLKIESKAPEPDLAAKVKELDSIDTQLLQLAQKRLQLEKKSFLNPYVYLKMYRELFTEQPGRLVYASNKCGYSLYTETQSTGDVVKDANEGETTEEASIEDEKKDPIFKEMAKYFGIASSVFGFVMLGKNIYKTYTVNEEMIRKINMFNEIRDVLQEEKAIAIEEKRNVDYRQISTKLSDLEVKYGDLFKNDGPPKKLKEDLEKINAEIDELENKIEEISKDKSKNRKTKNMQKNTHKQEIEYKMNNIDEKIKSFEEIDPKSGYKDPTKKYTGAGGKFIGAQVFAAGIIYAGFSLTQSDSAQKKIVNIDSEMFRLITEKEKIEKKLENFRY